MYSGSVYPVALKAVLPGLAPAAGILRPFAGHLYASAAETPLPCAQTSMPEPVPTPGAMRLRAASHAITRLRGFAAQPAFADKPDMFCFQVLTG